MPIRIKKGAISALCTNGPFCILWPKDSTIKIHFITLDFKQHQHAVINLSPVKIWGHFILGYSSTQWESCKRYDAGVGHPQYLEKMTPLHYTMAFAVLLLALLPRQAAASSVLPGAALIARLRDCASQ